MVIADLTSLALVLHSVVHDAMGGLQPALEAVKLDICVDLDFSETQTDFIFVPICQSSLLPHGETFGNSVGSFGFMNLPVQEESINVTHRIGAV